MTAQIIETNSTPWETADVDAVTVDIIENALRNVREEMDAVLFRTAMSPGIREQGDCFPMVANKDGKMVVGQFGSFIHGFMEAYDGEIEDGDFFDDDEAEADDEDDQDDDDDEFDEDDNEDDGQDDDVALDKEGDDDDDDDDEEQYFYGDDD